ncbi:unnamed protein product [Chondrus crispus]|uniref:Uncharacterized protein n=1 Tax=Chondrus crispus TaxID=2769 RepID=R7Q4D3_CHOCR|nr:unnamed protein product [Chondrus crispus]CDF33382.1 unnamed protein product [Chondrus crispus]|eukprot:XP_005713185.1 unnamed protein product [Chondrus crispus]
MIPVIRMRRRRRATKRTEQVTRKGQRPDRTGQSTLISFPVSRTVSRLICGNAPPPRPLSAPSRYAFFAYWDSRLNERESGER